MKRPYYSDLKYRTNIKGKACSFRVSLWDDDNQIFIDQLEEELRMEKEASREYHSAWKNKITLNK